MYGIMYAHGLLGTSCPARYDSTFGDVAIIFRDTSFELFMACEYHLLQVTHLTLKYSLVCMMHVMLVGWMLNLKIY